MIDDEQPIPHLDALRVQLPLYIGAKSAPLHGGVVLFLESKQYGMTQWGLTNEQCQALVQALNQSLQELDG